MVGGTKKSALGRELPAAIVTAGEADVSRSLLMRLLSAAAAVFTPSGRAALSQLVSP